MSYKISKPYSEKERLNFIVTHNHNQGLRIAETDTALYALEAYEELDGDIVVDNTEEYARQQAEEEANRIAMLNLTAADVERAIYKTKGLDFDDIISYLESQSMAEEAPIIDIKALKIELKANNFYRGNPYVQQIGLILGFTNEQLNRFFEYNDYRYLTSCTITISPTPINAKILINGLEQSTITVPYSEIIEYEVLADGYLTQTGTIELREDTTIGVELVEVPIEDIGGEDL